MQSYSLISTQNKNETTIKISVTIITGHASENFPNFARKLQLEEKTYQDRIADKILPHLEFYKKKKPQLDKNIFFMKTNRQKSEDTITTI